MTRFLDHLLLGSAAVAVLLSAGLAVRGIVRRDADARYTVVRAFLIAALAGPAIQLVAALWAPPALRIPAGWWASLAPSDGAGLLTITRSAVETWSGQAHSDSGHEGSEGVSAGAAPAGRAGWLARAGMLVGLYFAGCFVFAAATALRLFRTLAIIRAARPVRDPRVLRLWRDLAGAEPEARSARLLETPAIRTPSCWGMLRRHLLLPAGLASTVGEDTLRCALAHERVHLERGDTWFVLASRALACAFWFHPWAWAWTKLLGLEAELSCDARVVRTLRGRRTYGLALIELGRGLSKRNRILLPTFGGISLERRLNMMAKGEASLSRWHRRLLGVGLAGTLGGLLAVQGSAAATWMAAPAQSQQTTDKHEPSWIELRYLQQAADLVERVQVEAPAEGRAPEEVYDRLLQLNLIGREPFRLEAGMGLTEQETLVSAARAWVEGSRLEAEAFNMNLPEGSRLRAEFVGRQVEVRSQESSTQVTVHDGVVRLLDEGGVVRAEAKAAQADALLEVTLRPENGEAAMVVTAVGAEGPVDVHVVIDPQTGIPHDDGQPPHGSVRYRLFMDDVEAEKPVRFKMQWIYDLARLAEEAGVQETEPEENP